MRKNDGKLGLLDCGMTGRLDCEMREELEGMLLAAMDNDIELERLRELTLKGSSPPQHL